MRGSLIITVYCSTFAEFARVRGGVGGGTRLSSIWGGSAPRVKPLAFNPLSPDMKVYVLLTVLHTFGMQLVRRICLNIKTSYVVVSFILIT